MHFKAVDVVLQKFPAVEALSHVVDTINSCIFILSPDLSLSEACTFGSTSLLDWIWGISCTFSVERTREWSLANYLRSDRHYNHWQFSESLEVAAAHGNVAILEWIFTHFSHRDVSEQVVKAAAKNGHLSILQYFLAHAIDAKGSKRLRRGNSQDFRTFATVDGLEVSWGGSDMAEAVQNGHYDVARWLNEHTSYANKRRKVAVVVGKALCKDQFALAQELQPSGCNYISDYAFTTGQPDAIRWELSRGIVPRVQDARVAVEKLAERGELELLEQLVNLCVQASSNGKIWLGDDCFALSNACRNGQLAVVQWLMESPVGQKVPRGKRFTMEAASVGGHAQVMKYLCSHGFSDRSDVALIGAIQGGQPGSIEFLVGEFSYQSYDRKLVPFFDSVYTRCHSRQEQRRVIMVNGQFSIEFRKAVEYAASSGLLVMLKWLHEHHADEFIFTQRVMECAVHNNHLEVVKWLHANGVEACTTEFMDTAALKSYVDLVQWLHTNATAGCTTVAMDYAAYHGHFKMVKWLHSNRPEGCTPDAIQFALIHGNLQMTSWLLAHYPDHGGALQDWEGFDFGPEKLFEIVLFLHAHEPTAFTLEIRRRILRVSVYDVNGWMQENYKYP